MKIELFMDISKDNIQYNKERALGINQLGFYANSVIGNKMDTDDRIKITINLPDRYFKESSDLDATVENIEILNNDLNNN